MEAGNCAEFLSWVVEDASEKYKATARLNSGRYDILVDEFETLDGICTEFDAESANISVDEDSMDICVSIVMSDIIFDGGRADPVVKLLNCLKAFKFINNGHDTICISLVFPSVWDFVAGGGTD